MTGQSDVIFYRLDHRETRAGGGGVETGGPFNCKGFRSSMYFVVDSSIDHPKLGWIYSERGPDSQARDYPTGRW